MMFDDPLHEPGVTELDGGWIVETREIGPVSVTVMSDNKDIRERIFSSASPVTNHDSSGCTPSHDAGIGRSYRPANGDSAFPPADTIESVSVCRYTRTDHGGVARPLLSSSRLTGTEATSIVDALHSSPVGEGPNDPDSCAERQAYGQELLVLGIHASNRTHEVLVRYHGCDGHGIDDGDTKRKLTSDVLQPLLKGAHQPNGLTGVVAELL